jgi:pantoate ligase/cytidylate kinase
VNPLQFGPNEDLDTYPHTLTADLAQCEASNVDAVFCPLPQTLYGRSQPTGAELTRVQPTPSMTMQLCGPYRPGHFAGVTTVVAKLFNLVAPQRAYFGRKDAQQLAIIKRMVVDLNWPVTVVGCPIVRETNGLALSSRNHYLSPTEHDDAAALYQGLQAAKQAFLSGEHYAQALIDVVKDVVSQVSTIQV